jgi:leucine dehydrogenase
MVFTAMASDDHDRVSFFTDPESGLRAIIAVHDTHLGPALGGTRILPYEDEAAALSDVLRLSRAMTYKAAAADLDLGGGKAVVLGDPAAVKSEALFRAYGRAVDAMGGRYVTCEDVNSDVTDMDVVAEVTDHVVGTSDGLGDPSPVTAFGVYHGIRACLGERHGDPAVTDVDVAVQGIGKVGWHLAERLVEAGANVTVADVDDERVAAFTEEYGVETVAPEEILTTSCDVFAPCALGGVITDATVDQLDCDVVAGSANNVLADREQARALAERDVLYAPDYVINAGGLITMAMEVMGEDEATAYRRTEQIGPRLSKLIQEARDTDRTVLAAADDYARSRIADSGTDPLSVPPAAVQRER